MENNIQRIITEIINEISIENNIENNSEIINRRPMIQFIIPPINNINDELLNRSFQDQRVLQKPICKKFLEELEEITIEKENENKTCSICLEEFKYGDKVLKLPCTGQYHYFHSNKTEQCDGIVPWFKDNNTCPVCRCEFPEEKSELTQSLISTSNTELSDEQVQELNIDGEAPQSLNDNIEEEVVNHIRPIDIMNQIMRRVVEEEREIMMNEEEELQRAIMNSIDDK